MGARGRERGAVIVIASLAALLFLPTGARADRGAAVDVGRIDVDEVLRPGRSYTLPMIGVRNPGTEPTDYALGVSPLETDLLAVPEDWMSFAPATLSLDPDEKRSVEPTLEIPGDAAAGDYETLLAAQVITGGEGARVGAAAATRLTFTVSRDPASPDRDGVLDGWLLGLVLTGGLVILGWNATRFRIRIERRR